MLTSGAFGYMADYLLGWVLLASLVVHTWCFFRFFPWKRWKKSGLAAGNALVFACILGFAAMAAESYLRFAAVETDAFGVSLPARRWFALHTSLNSLGCRDVEWAAEKPPGVRRVAFVGDSLTYGWGVPRVEDRFTERVEAMFERRRPGTVEVMNVAKPGWGTGAQLVPIGTMIVQYAADEIVLCYSPNDIEDLVPTSDDFNPTRPPEPMFFNPDSSCLLDYLYRRIYIPRAATVRGYFDWLAAGYEDERISQQHQRQLDDMLSYCRDRGVRFRVVLLPFIGVGAEAGPGERLHAAARRFLTATGSEVLDLLPAVTGIDPVTLMVNAHDAHPNERAHELFAEAIWEAFYERSEP